MPKTAQKCHFAGVHGRASIWQALHDQGCTIHQVISFLGVHGYGTSKERGGGGGAFKTLEAGQILLLHCSHSQLTEILPERFLTD